MSSSFSDVLRTPPHIITLRFGIMLVAQYEAKKERLARGRREGWDVSSEEAFLAAREWQYQQALEAIKEAPGENLAQALTGVNLGRALLRRLRAAGLADKIAQARRVNGS